jgi:hypothetical protein
MGVAPVSRGDLRGIVLWVCRAYAVAAWVAAAELVGMKSLRFNATIMVPANTTAANHSPANNG